jgi:large subunit ribosomal protein L16
MFIPKKSKFKKQQKGKLCNRIDGSIFSSDQLHFGSVGLKALTHDNLTSKQMEAIRQSINKVVKKTGKIIIKSFPNIPVSKKPIEVRMGKGKGAVDHWVFKVKPGYILCEIITDQVEIGVKALTMVKKKLSIKTKIILN